MLKIYLASLAAVAVLVGIFYWYYTSSQETIAILNANNAKLEIALETQKQALESIKNDLQTQQNVLQQTYKDFDESRRLNQELSDRLSRHDLGFLAAKKPKLVENIVNKATSDAARCLEILSGSPLTEKEKNATKKSEINNECPSIANPRWRANR